MHLFSSLAQFSLIASFCVFLQKIRGASRNFFYFYIYIYKIEIRNSEIYLPEVSVSSTMDATGIVDDATGIVDIAAKVISCLTPS